MEVGDPFAIERLVATIPVRSLGQLDRLDYLQRLEDVLRLFAIDAVSDGHGIEFRGDGVAEDDQPLVSAIATLAARRFGWWVSVDNDAGS
jgi:hypothetical protein